VIAYPELSAAEIVASDLAHSVPLNLIAGIAHGGTGSVHVPVLTMLLTGSLPGIFIGSTISTSVPKVTLRYVLAAALIAAGGRLAVQMVREPRPLTAHAAPTHGDFLDPISYSPARAAKVAPHSEADHSH
jgi:uncharacterized membrane protein YfcA